MGLLGLQAAAPGVVAARELPLPAGAEIVGEVRTVTAKAEETLLDIARRFDIGYEEIIAANPGIDPWLPEDGSTVTIPGRYVLPDAPRRGLVINLPEMRLYYFPRPPRGQPATVVTHPIGVGREGWHTPLGPTRIVAKEVDPAWHVPASIRREKLADGTLLPGVVPPGPDNPLGRFALRLGHRAFLLHGTNRPYSVGMRVSHGCLRLYPEDIATLFRRVAKGTPVMIVDQPYKFGRGDGVLYLEAHKPLAQDAPAATNIELTPVVRAVSRHSFGRLTDDQWQVLFDVARKTTGIPVPVGELAQYAAPESEVTKPKGDWLLVAGLFRHKPNALRLMARLRQDGFGASTKLDSQRFWRVLVGPYDSRRQAKQAQPTLDAIIGESSVVVRAGR